MLPAAARLQKRVCESNPIGEGAPSRDLEEIGND